MNIRYCKTILLITISLVLSACGFHLQGKTTLVPQLHRMYLQTSDPYGVLARSLRQYLKMSNVYLTPDALSAKTILVILQDTTSEELISVSSTEQTRQYNLRVTVLFELSDNKGRVIMPPQSINETRTITVQSNQILGNSNEANLYYQQMRQQLAYAIMNRISSREISDMITHHFITVQLVKP